MRERLRWLGHVLRIKDVKYCHFHQPPRVELKAGRTRLGWEDVVRGDLREMGTSWEGVKRESLHRLGRRSKYFCVCLRQRGSTISC